MTQPISIDPIEPAPISVSVTVIATEQQLNDTVAEAAECLYRRGFGMIYPEAPAYGPMGRQEPVAFEELSDQQKLGIVNAYISKAVGDLARENYSFKAVEAARTKAQGEASNKFIS
jgi:hypothetical protein